MTELPDGWRGLSLTEVARGGLLTDGDWVESKDQDPQGSVRLTQLADVGVGEFRDRSSRWLREDQAAALRCTFLQPSDVLIARMPDPIGRACLVPDGIGRAVTAVDVAILRVVDPEIAPRYVMWAVNNPTFHSIVESLQSGTTRKRISRKNLAALAIPIPDAREQLRIVDILEEHLSRLDAAEQALERVRLRTAGLHLSALQSLMSEAGGRATTLGEVATWGSGGTPLARTKAFYEGGTIPWVVSGDLRDGELTVVSGRITQQGYESSSAKWVPAGAVLVAMYGATIGRLAIVAEAATTNQAVAHAIPGSELEASFLFWFLRSQRGSLVAAGKGGAQPNISQTILKDWPIRVPSVYAQRNLVKQAMELHAACQRLDGQVLRATERRMLLRRALLVAAFSGRLTGRAADMEMVEEMAHV